MSLTTTVFCKTASSTSPAPHCWRSHRKKYLASLAKLKSALSIEPDICPKAEHVCYSNDLSCCFIIRDIDGRRSAIFLFGTSQPTALCFGNPLQKKKTSHIWENLCSDHKTQSFHYFHHYFLGVRFMLISRSLLQLSSILGKHHLYHLKEELLTDSSDRLLEV